MSDNEALNEAMYQCSVCGPNHEPGSSKHFSRNPAQALTLDFRLRSIAENAGSVSPQIHGALETEAADRIEELEAGEDHRDCKDHWQYEMKRAEQAEAERDEYRARYNVEAELNKVCEAERDKYKQQVQWEREGSARLGEKADRLRAALMEITHIIPDTVTAGTMRKIAERALEGEG